MCQCECTRPVTANHLFQVFHLHVVDLVPLVLKPDVTLTSKVLCPVPGHVTLIGAVIKLLATLVAH